MKNCLNSGSCPKCGYSSNNSQDPLFTAHGGLGECPSCGIIVAKYSGPKKKNEKQAKNRVHSEKSVSNSRKQLQPIRNFEYDKRIESQVVTFKPYAEDLRHGPLPSKQLTGWEGGVNFHRADAQHIEYGKIMLVSTFVAKIEDREKLHIWFFIQGSRRPYSFGFDVIRYGDFINTKNISSSREGLKQFILFLLEKNPNLIIDQNTHQFLKNDEPYTLTESVISYATGLGRLLNLDENDTNAKQKIPEDDLTVSCPKCRRKQQPRTRCIQCGQFIDKSKDLSKYSTEHAVPKLRVSPPMSIGTMGFFGFLAFILIYMFFMVIHSEFETRKERRLAKEMEQWLQTTMINSFDSAEWKRIEPEGENYHQGKGVALAGVPPHFSGVLSGELKAKRPEEINIIFWNYSKRKIELTHEPYRSFGSSIEEMEIWILWPRKKEIYVEILKSPLPPIDSKSNHMLGITEYKVKIRNIHTVLTRKDFRNFIHGWLWGGEPNS